MAAACSVICCQEEIEASEADGGGNQHFATFVPFAARFPAETGIYSRRHVRTLMDLTNAELDSLAQIISVMRRKYDNLYGFLCR